MVVWNGNGCSIYRTETHRCACYIIESGKARVLVDTSMKFERSALENSIGRTGELRIDAIFLTHSHTDHAANAKYYSDKFNCPVYISPKGTDRLRQGYCVLPKGTNPYSKVVCSIEPTISFYNFTQFEACTEVQSLSNEVVTYYLGNAAHLLETPGHSDDSVSIIVNNAVAIIGDTAVNAFGNKYPPFADDEKAVINSWGKLLKTKCSLFCPAHGKVFPYSELMQAYQKHKII